MTPPDQRIDPPPQWLQFGSDNGSAGVPSNLAESYVERVRILIELGRLDGISISESEASPPLREARAREIRELEAMVELTPL